MVFEMNKNEWKIIEISSNLIVDIYKQEIEDEDVLYVYGLTRFPLKTIYINQDIIISKKKQTLRHELMHAYIEEYCSSKEEFTEEELCDISSKSHNIIHEIVKRYFKVNGTLDKK